MGKHMKHRRWGDDILSVPSQSTGKRHFSSSQLHSTALPYTEVTLMLLCNENVALLLFAATFPNILSIFCYYVNIRDMTLTTE
jgi:hypothetical protein